jgi:putative ABC transport system substrate-binding protein
LIALAPDVILAVTSAATGPLLQSARAVPIVFVMVAEPVVAGFADSLAKPGGTSCCLNTASAANGWNCSRRLRPA